MEFGPTTYCSCSVQAEKKKQYSKDSSDIVLKVGDRVMVKMPGEIKGNEWKFARPLHGPLRAIKDWVHDFCENFCVTLQYNIFCTCYEFES